jgi:RNA polymerase sigma factor, sigma-70 family
MIPIPQIILTIESDDDRAFMTQLYEKYHRLMYKEILTIVKNHADTEDVLHNTIVSLIRKIDTLRKFNERRLANYIITACKNTARNLFRNRKEILITFEELDEVADDSNIENFIVHVENLNMLAEVWPDLPERDKHLLEGKYILEKSDVEMSKELGISANSVRMYLSRARKRALKQMSAVSE